MEIGQPRSEGYFGREELAGEGHYHVRLIVGREELLEAYRLRYRTFCQKLNWVSCKEDGLEYDSYDESAVSFGVYDDEGRLAAYARLIMPHGRFMLEDIFPMLLGPAPIVRKEPDTAEISRLCIEPRKCADAGRHALTLLLFSGLYEWCVKREIRFLYAVTDDKTFKTYSSNEIPFRLMGEPVRMPDGVVARAAVLDWREYKKANGL